MNNLKLGSTGPFVELLQSKLKKLDYYKGEITGIFDYSTENALRYFQKNFDTKVTGVVDEQTLQRLNPYLNGFIEYVIEPGDTIFNLAGHFRTTIDEILAQNKGINIYNLEIGSKIIIPFGNIVPTDVSYSYEIMQININSFKKLYNFLEFGNIGKSVLGKEISYIKIGKGSKKLCYNASIHANEWITSPLLMKFIEDFSRAYILYENIFSYSARDIFDQVTIYVIPMLNPDGVNLVTGAEENIEVLQKTEAISSNFPDIKYKEGWKANINGIDLNLQFPAGWEKAKTIKYSQGFVMPAPRDFVGYGPLTAIESVNLYEFTRKHDFSMILTYHSQGKVIYWKYLNYEPDNSLYIAKQFARVSGYEIENTPYASGFAGYKDWFIQEYNRPGYTIEVGIGENPLPISQFDEIYNDNIGILVLATRLI